MHSFLVKTVCKSPFRGAIPAIIEALSLAATRLSAVPISRRIRNAVAAMFGIVISGAAGDASAVVIIDFYDPPVTRGTKDNSFVFYALNGAGGGNPLPYVIYPEDLIFQLTDYDAVSVTAAFSHLPTEIGGAYGYGSGFVSADLRTGQLRASASSTWTHSTGAEDYAVVDLGDRIFLHGLTEATTVTVTMAYEGMIQGDDNQNFAFLNLMARRGESSLFNYNDPLTLTGAGIYDGVLSVTFPVFPEFPYFDLIARLHVNSMAAFGGSSLLDFSHTATIDLLLEDGISFTSESGVFLTGITTVSEPASSALLASGLLGMLLCRCRRAAAKAREISRDQLAKRLV